MDCWTATLDTGDADSVTAIVLKSVDLILVGSIRLGASHIFIDHQWMVTPVRPDSELWQHQSVVTFRVNNMRRHFVDLPGTLHDRIVRRIKLMAGILLTDPRTPQSGGFRFSSPFEKAGEVRNFSFSVSSMPAPLGDKLVLKPYELTGTLVRFRPTCRAVDGAKNVVRNVGSPIRPAQTTLPFRKRR
jgi:type II secretory ATPase GspE/PulE/Tfp pilus assembly ATPase PilB-like protein